MGTAALTELDTDEVSIVDQGAVRRTFAILKGKGQMSDKILEAVLKQQLPPELEKKLKAAIAKLDPAGGMTPQAKDALKGLLKLLTSFGDQLGQAHLTALSQLCGFVGNQTQPAEGDDTSTTDAATAADETSEPADTDADGDTDASDQDGVDDQDKAAAPPSAEDGTTPPPAAAAPAAPAAPAKPGGFPAKKPDAQKRGTAVPNATAPNKELDAIRKRQEQLQAENVALKKQAADQAKALAIEVQKRRERETVAKCEKEFPHIPQAPVELAKMLMDAEDKGLAEPLLKQWRAWNEQTKTAGLFQTAGYNLANGDPGGEDESAKGQLKKIAKSMQEKEPGLPWATAYDRAYQGNLDLVRQMRSEQRRGARG